MDNEIREAVILQKSIIDGEESRLRYLGQYRKTPNMHTVVFSCGSSKAAPPNDLDGGQELVLQIHADGTGMLIRRTCRITADMLFDLCTDTIVDYAAGPVKHRFMLHTDSLTLTEKKMGLIIRTEYTLSDDGAEKPISGKQEIRILFKE